MSKETMEDLQTNTLIGMVSERGHAWHRRDDLRRLPDGTLLEDNHYPGMIPVADVKRRLFDWQPEHLPVAYLRPLPEAPTGGFVNAVVQFNGAFYEVLPTQRSLHGVIRSDNDYDMGIFSASAHHSPYSVTLIREAERLTGATLGISSAGLLSKGGRAWVELSLPETLHDPKSGFNYRPNLLKADSMDGTLAMTSALTINATVCDNTLSLNLSEAANSGRIFRRKHTSGCADNLNEERQVLGILEESADDFLAQLHALIEVEMSEKQVIEVLDIIMPLPVELGRARTQADNRRENWLHIYHNDPMAAEWAGTALGVVQTHNTYDHWYSRVQGPRSERNTWRVINGEREKTDKAVVRAIEAVALR